MESISSPLTLQSPTIDEYPAIRYKNSSTMSAVYKSSKILERYNSDLAISPELLQMDARFRCLPDDTICRYKALPKFTCLTPTLMRSKAIIDEFENTPFFKKDKKAQKLYQQSIKEYQELLERQPKITARKILDGDYIYGKLALKEIQILQYETFFMIEAGYYNIIQAVKNYEDPCRTDNEKRLLLPKVEDAFVEFNDLIKRMRFLDFERHRYLRTGAFPGSIWERLIESIRNL